jgi:hypothetical protein
MWLAAFDDNRSTGEARISSRLLTSFFTVHLGKKNARRRFDC